MYARRSKVDPLWNSLIVAGVDRRTAKPFLGYVDLLGTTYESPTIATGFGMHLAQPLLRKAVEEKQVKGEEINESEAREILESCMKVLCELSCFSAWRASTVCSRAHTCTLSLPQQSTVMLALSIA